MQTRAPNVVLFVNNGSIEWCGEVTMSLLKAQAGEEIVKTKTIGRVVTVRQTVCSTNAAAVMQLGGRLCERTGERKC